MSIRILATKKLTPSQKALLYRAQIDVVDYNAITLNFLKPKIDPNFKKIICTSQNTVKAFLKIIASQNIERKSYTAFCVGERTKLLLEKNDITVKETTNYGAELAKIIAQKYPEESFLFLCGNKRRQEIPTYFLKHKGLYKEQIIYQNTPNPRTFTAHFDGILFFSPSGIESFTIHNSLKNEHAFCIGTTTASTAKKYTKNIIIAQKPTVESVLERVITSFETKINTQP